MSAVMLRTLDSHTTLPELVNHHLEHNAEATFAVFPSTISPVGVERVTFLQFGQAVHRFARVALSHVQPGEVVGLIATADTLLYIAAMAGFIQAGITVFPISPRNSPSAVIHMLRKVSAQRLMVTTSLLQSLVSGIQQELSDAGNIDEIGLLELPPFTNIFPSLNVGGVEDRVERVPLPPQGVLKNDVVIYVHSSGSTGFPKPIPWTKAFTANQRHSPLFTEMPDRDIVFGSMSLPSFHAFGIFCQLWFPLLTGRPVALFAPQYPRAPVVSSPEVALQALKKTRANSAVVVPTFLEIWAQDNNAVDFLKTMHMVGYGGGPLATGFGDSLATRGVQLAALYGGTEFSLPTRIWPSPSKPPQEWAWLRIADRARPRWVEMGDGQYELQFLTRSTHVLAVENLPDVRGYSTQDLWVKHPTKEGLWRIVGRADDVIILANGEKTVPGPQEAIISSSPLVQSAVMFGRERNQVGVLIEPSRDYPVDSQDEVALTELRNALWPVVDRANTDAPAFSRILKEMILVTRSDKPLPRTPKGTIQRKIVLAKYAQEIETLYEAVEKSGNNDDIAPPVEWTAPAIMEWILRVCMSIQDGSAPDPRVDLFEQGFDSLSATSLRNRIINVLRSSPDPAAKLASSQVQNGIVYANPTVLLLASAVVGLVNPADGDQSSSATQAVQNMIEKYSEGMPTIAPGSLAAKKPDSFVVLLTGSTGGLGSQLLSACLSDDHVHRVYAFNRPSTKATSEERHRSTFLDRGLDLDLLRSPKLVYLEGDTGVNQIGLGQVVYDEACKSVTTIIHNAWRLDFNLSLSSFEPNVRGVRNLLDLALASPRASHVRVLFTSSIAVAMNWPRERGPFPEEPTSDSSFAIGQGYGEAKYVGERLLIKAAEHGLPTTSFRIGQITGGYANGAWATTDWVPILIKSSIALGCLPDAQGVASWAPPEAISQAILDVAFSETKPDLALNLVHPHPVPWRVIFEHVVESIAKSCPGMGRLPLVPWPEWYEKLQGRVASATEDDLKAIPGIKLTAFYGGQAAADKAVREAGIMDGEAAGLSALATVKAQHASPTLRELPQLGEEIVAKWMSYWRTKGLLP